ncbi:MAG: hypothetical protein PHQ40_05780 [Anaerolineaceae bacterium]|nr:hypothetical protein [Anaerolineaceae bacterium]
MTVEQNSGAGDGANLLPDLQTGAVVLVLGPRAAQGAMLELSAGLACRGALRVLDGGNQFNAYRLARALRRQTVDIHTAMARISLARAFTCYQMEALLASSATQPIPTLVFDLLATFYDESVALTERRRLLGRAVRHLQRLSQAAPVAVSAQPAGPAQAERTVLLEMLRSVTGLAWELEMPTLPALPPALF